MGGVPFLHTDMKTYDHWGTQLPFDSRQKIVNKITGTLMRHPPYSGHGINEVVGVASRFEDKIFRVAVSQDDYLRKISMKMFIMETKSKNAGGSSSSLPPDSNSLPLNLGHRMINDNSEPSLVKEEPAMDTYDWRTQLPFDSRQKIVNKILDTLMRHLPFSGPEGINELMGVASRFEEKVFNIAVSQTDYLHKISMKMLTMETKSKNAAGSSSSISADNNSLPLHLGHLMINDISETSLLKGEPAMNTCDWRTHLPPDSRQNIVYKLTETLKKHVTYSGQEGIDNLRRLAISLEECVFNTAINQVDYIRKISLKMQTIEEGG